MLWASDEEGQREVGCIHTCQGIEFDYVGVIIGNDLRIDNNNNLISSWDDYYNTGGKLNLSKNKKELIKYIKNIYKVLMTRGKKGCYLFIRDNKVKEYFLKHMKQS